jgi:integrase
MSSLYLRGSTWWAKSYRNGRMIRQSLRTESKAEAKQRVREMDAERKRDMRAAVTGVTTWETAAQDLREYYTAYGTRDAEEAEHRLRALTGYFRSTRLSAIDAPAIQGYVAHRKRQGRAAGTINVELATLRRALRLAHEHGKLAHVPRVRLLRPATPRSGFFEPEMFEAVCQALPVDLQLVARIGYTYGWRINSEVLTLTKAQVDLDAGTLRLEPGMTKNRDGRLVHLTPELKAMLAEQLGRVKVLERELSQVIPWVFPTSYGPYKGRRRSRVVRAWQRACREAGCPGRLKHDLRRTAARNMVNLGIPEKVVMKIGGWKTRSMLDRYHIVSPGDLQEATRRLSAQAEVAYKVGT